jgi:hypothetical protein
MNASRTNQRDTFHPHRDTAPTFPRIRISALLEDAVAREISVMIQELTLPTYAPESSVGSHRIGAVEGAFLTLSHIPARFVLAFLGDLLQSVNVQGSLRSKESSLDSLALPL